MIICGIMDMKISNFCVGIFPGEGLRKTFWRL